MFNAKKAKKPLIIILYVVFGLTVMFAAFLGSYYLSADALVYHYINISDIYINGVDYNQRPEKREDYPRQYPFFGNPLTISEESGTSIHFPLHGGEKNYSVYEAINSPIQTWIFYLQDRYKNDAFVRYTVEIDKEYIKVYFTGTVTEDGKTVPIEQNFIFDIANASPENLPVWVNREEISEGFKGYLAYLDDHTKVPDWLKPYIVNTPY